MKTFFRSLKPRRREFPRRKSPGLFRAKHGKDVSVESDHLI